MKYGKNVLCCNLCLACRQVIPGWKADTCSNACRQKLYRARKKLLAMKLCPNGHTLANMVEALRQADGKIPPRKRKEARHGK